jgi:hypothetical protein
LKILAFALFLTSFAEAKGLYNHRCWACEPDAHHRNLPSRSAKREFQKSHPCPSTGKTSGACPGYVIDHIVSPNLGGADVPYNMQWLTKPAANPKSKTE